MLFSGNCTGCTGTKIETRRVRSEAVTKRQRAADAPPAAPPSPLGLAEATTAGEAYDKIARALDAADLSPGERIRLAIQLLRERAGVVSAEEFRRRLELTEATAREAQRRAAQRAVIEAEVVPVEGENRG